MSVINWQYTRDLNDINTAIQNHDSDWEGLTSADQIINITFDSNHGCYVIFWRVKDTTEIIHCWECKHRDMENGLCEGRGWPMQLVPDDGFCDKGERREKTNEGNH